MAIPDSFIMQLKQTADIEDVISTYCTVTRSGRNRKCLCPFHSEKTPSLVLYPETQSFYCFGCGAGGDAITFIMKMENLDYPEAIRFLARRVGLEVPESSGDDGAYQLRARILELNRATARFFHRCLYLPVGKQALDYLTARGLTEKTIKTYGLGYAPQSWDALINHLKKKGFTQAEMIAAAVVAKGRSGSYYDQFRNRVMFPIIDLRGNVIAFGGRVLDDSRPKYLNSGDTAVFKKSRNLFSLNFAKTETADRTLILAEGYMDVISIYQAEFHNVVATLGTALTDEQARLMARYADKVVIAYDSDAAGQAASQRALNLLADVGVETRRITMEGAKDPDEFIKKFGPTRFKMMLDGADNPIEYELSKFRKTVNLDTPDGKLAYLRKGVSVLSGIKNELEREVYAAKLANETGTNRDAVLTQVDSAIAKQRRSNKNREWRDIQTGRKLYQDRVNPQRATHLKQALAEEGILVYLFRNPDSYEYICTQLGAEHFVTDFNRKIFEVLLGKLKNSAKPDISLLSGELTVDEIGKFSGILAKSQEIGNSKEQLDDYIRVLVDYAAGLNPKALAESDDDTFKEYVEKLRERKNRP